MNVHSREAELSRALRDGPFHHALRAAIEARGLALHRVRHRLAQRGINVGVTSLSYWQQGARRPARSESLRAVRALEEVLDLPADSLTRHLASAGGAGCERPASRSYQTLVARSDVLRGLLTELEAPLDGGLHTLDHWERVRIGPHRELLTRASQQAVRAHRDGVDRYLAIHHGDPGCAPASVRVHAEENCRVGRVRWHAGASVVVAELLFDTRLRAGETYVFGYAFEDGTGGESREYVRGFSFGGGQYVLQVCFDATALPVRCLSFSRASAAARPSHTQDLTLSGANRTVHLVRAGAGPGILGIGWDWD
ncbi:hypothetical protein [Streptomyces iconiensis]|uniref:XRE family transcriptional regulator n=1 Tax=Streptomyces iconiensis TaxID=1384038 RepID=A0ABT6ZVQ9_9ACTN|nr:hypothetical protein [Streptomyces iconiensis]MDJ1133156.1 hypothetical protein [Streptomyces iconiensis]